MSKIEKLIDIQKVAFDKSGLIPCIAQDITTGEVLMLAYMNKQALEMTVETGLVTYYSRSRKELWTKGLTSGHYQHLEELFIDCDSDCLLVKVKQDGVACHTGNKTCFYSLMAINNEPKVREYSIIQKVFDTVKDRKENPVEGSYTNYLFNKGREKICKKIGEEATETVIAAISNNIEELSLEISDLMYHLCVLMVECGISLQNIYEVLWQREGKPPLAKYKQ